jgi:sec-independent protein translocase protein TatC
MALFKVSEPEEIDMSFWEHLDALRPRIMRSVVAMLIFMIAAFLFGDALMKVVTGPMSAWFPTNRFFAWMADAMSSDVLRINSDPVQLINTAMAGQLNLHLSIAFHTALLLAIPYLLWEFWGFVRPALSRSEQQRGRFFVLRVSMFFFTGVLFGYFVLAPLSVNFLSGYRVSESIANMIDISSYMSLVLNMTFVCGVIFLLPVLASLLSGMGLLTADFMRNYRRHAIIVLAVLAAFVTPPDAVSMILVLIPLYGLYELSISVAARGEKRYHSSLSRID